MERIRDNGIKFSLLKLAEGTLFSSVALILGRVFGLLIKILLARLGTESFGLFNLIKSIINTLLIFCALGIPLGITRYTSYFLGQGKKDKIKNVLLTAIIVIVPISLLITLIFYLIAPYFGLLFKQPNTILYLRIILIGLPFFVLVNIGKAILTGFLKISYLFLLDNLEKFLNLFFIAFFLYLGLGLTGAIIAVLLSIIIISIITLRLIFQVLPVRKLQFRFFKELFSFSWPVSLSEILRTFACSADLLLLGFYIGTVEVGEYSVIISLSSLILIFPQLILSIFFPIITNLYGSKKDIGTIYKTITFWLFIVLVPTSIFLIFNGQAIGQLLFGQEYLISKTALFFLILANFTFSLLLWGGRQVLDMLKLTKENLKLTFIRVTILLVLWSLLIPKWGSIGASAVWLIGWFIESILCILIIFKKTGIFFGEKKYFSVLIIGLLPYLIFLTFPLIPGKIIVQIVLRAFFYFSIYIFLYLRFLYSDIDKAFLKIISSKLFRKKRE